MVEADPCHLSRRNVDKGGNIEFGIVLMKQNSVKSSKIPIEEYLNKTQKKWNQSWISVHDNIFVNDQIEKKFWKKNC